MARYQKLERPTAGTRISLAPDGSLEVPDDPIVPFIQGDGVGPEIWAAARKVVDAAVERAFKGKRAIHWFEIFAGEKAKEIYGPDCSLPDDTLQAISEYVVAIKGPLETPAGDETRSLNVTMRRKLDLFACVRPCKALKGVPSSARARLDVVIVRENTEDAYAGPEWEEGSLECRKLIAFIREELGAEIRRDSAVGIKAISATGTKRLVRMALRYSLDNKRSTVTLAHKGNIMKATEGSFRRWAYQLAKDEFPQQCLTESEVLERHGGKTPKGTLKLNEGIADAMFRGVALSPADYDVIVCPNVVGSYLSDACAAQVGGPGMAPSANIGEQGAVFETAHGTALEYTGQDKVNPGAMILAAKMLLEHMGWQRAANLIERGMEEAVAEGKVTFDFARLIPGSTVVGCSAYADAVVRRME